MKKGFSPEHRCELLRDSLEQFLDGSGVSYECGGHLEATGRDVTDGGLHVVWDPFYEIAAVLVLYIQHLFINFLKYRCFTSYIAF